MKETGLRRVLTCMAIDMEGRGACTKLDLQLDVRVVVVR